MSEPIEPILPLERRAIVRRLLGTPFAEWLCDHHACLRAVKWVGKRSLHDAWFDDEYGDYDEDGNDTGPGALEMAGWMAWLVQNSISLDAMQDEKLDRMVDNADIEGIRREFPYETIWEAIFGKDSKER